MKSIVGNLYSGANLLLNTFKHNIIMNGTKLLKLSLENSESLAMNGAEALKNGGIIGVPTDTIYGIASDAQNSEAVAQIYRIKGRNFNKPIAICVSDISQVYSWGKVTVSASLLEDLLPGPVTLVFERLPCLNANLNPSTNLIGIRIPDYNFMRQLSSYHPGPIALTSANLSSAPSTLSPEEFKSLWPQLNLIFDGGCLSNSRAGSTVIDLSEKGHFKIIRQGNFYDNFIKILSEKYNLVEKH